MRTLMLDVNSTWSTLVEVRAPDDTSDEVMEEAAGVQFEDSFSLKDFMRGLNYDRVELHPPDAIAEEHIIAIIDKHGNVTDWLSSEDEE